MSCSCSNSVRGVIAGLGCIVYSGKLKAADEMTAVDDERRTGHVAGCIGSQQQQRTFEIFDITGAPLRDTFDHRRAGFAGEVAAIDFGREVTRPDAVDANVVTGQL